MIQENRGGTTLKFIIVGIVLIGLLAVGIFWARQQSQQTAGDTQPEVVAENGSETEPQPSEVVVEEESAPTKENPLPATGEISQELPQTGMAETLAASATLGVLSFLAVSYLRSRRIIASL